MGAGQPSLRRLVPLKPRPRLDRTTPACSAGRAEVPSVLLLKNRL